MAAAAVDYPRPSDNTDAPAVVMQCCCEFLRHGSPAAGVSGMAAEGLAERTGAADSEQTERSECSESCGESDSRLIKTAGGEGRTAEQEIIKREKVGEESYKIF